LTAPIVDERKPPYSPEAEQSVIGAVLGDNTAYDVAAALVQRSDFYMHEHQHLWGAIERLVLRGKPADMVTVAEELGPALEGVGGLAYINALALSVPSARNAQAYAAIVRERAQCRRLIALASWLTDEAHDLGRRHGGMQAVVDKAVLDLLAMLPGQAQGEPRPIRDALPAWIDEVNARAEGRTDAIPLGLREIDRVLAGGVRRGEVFVLGARPSMGKSAFMLTVARNVAAHGPVLVCSMEDSEHMLVSRQVAAAGRVNLADIRNPARAAQSMWDGVASGVEALQPLRLHLDDRPALTLQDLRRKALQVQRREGDLVLLLVDYLQLMEGEGETRAAELTAIARGMKRLAKELRCCVMLLSQLNRKADETNAPPGLHHLAETDGLEQAADIIGLLWRESRRKPTPDNKHKAQVELAKQKNGPTATVQLWFDGATQRFEDAVVEEGAGY
jgi:replicative DNA helicase